MSGSEQRVTATIVPFRAHARPVDRPDSADPRRGTVLLFTGVRYERLPDPAPLESPPPGRTPPRGDLRKRG